MKKILIVGMTESIGGIEKYILGIVKNADSQKYKFTFLDCCHGSKEIVFKDVLYELGCEVKKITNRKENYFKSFFDLYNFIKSSNFDIVHIHVMSYSWFEPIYFSTLNVNTKVILHCHIDPHNNLLSNKVKIFDKIGRFLCHNKKIIRLACGNQAGKNFFNTNDFVTLYNGINLNKYIYNDNYRYAIRSKYNISKDSVILCNVARFSIQKNLLFLLDVFYEFHKKYKDSYLFLVGEGEQRSLIENKIQDYDISDFVILTGNISNVNEIYSASDYFVMPSFYEGFSIALVEAQSNGLICLTSDSIDNECNITGRVEFLPLNLGPKFWADKIIPGKYDRTVNMPDIFDEKKCYSKLYSIYDE